MLLSIYKGLLGELVDLGKSIVRNEIGSPLRRTPSTERGCSLTIYLDQKGPWYIVNNFT